jgi:hypothetical protein
MDLWIDRLARRLGGGITRRAVFRGLGGGLTGAALVSIGAAERSANAEEPPRTPTPVATPEGSTTQPPRSQHSGNLCIESCKGTDRKKSAGPCEQACRDCSGRPGSCTGGDTISGTSDRQPLFSDCGDEDCSCFGASEGGGFCGSNHVFCENLQTCSSSQDCAANEVCAVNTCCGEAVCIPVCFTGSARGVTSVTRTSGKGRRPDGT